MTCSGVASCRGELLYRPRGVGHVRRIHDPQNLRDAVAVFGDRDIIVRGPPWKKVRKRSRASPYFRFCPALAMRSPTVD